MNVEKEFDREIPDEKSARMFTVGALYEWLKIHASCGIPDADEEIWQRLARVVAIETNFEQSKITVETSFSKDLGIG